MKKAHKHVRQHGKAHDEAHEKLKQSLLAYDPDQEKLGGVFVVTFIVVLFSLLFFRNWGNILELAENRKQQPPTQSVQTNGFQDGVLSVYRVDDQVNRSYRHYIGTILTEGSALAATSTASIGAGNQRIIPSRPQEEALKDSVWLTSYLSTGQHLTKLQQKQARALQKSILSTYYLGEKTVDIDNTIDLDTRILKNNQNTLGTDLFQYLSQAPNRADALDEYLHLLENLRQTDQERINDLQSKINFLRGNFQSLEAKAETSQDVFFNNLQIFNSENANEQLAQFVGAAEAQVEIRAKIGAYESLKEYYEFFLPQIDTLIASIRANRDALIAGVKVVEIQNMTLPLIIREQ